jgi:hypothetical protein
MFGFDPAVPRRPYSLDDERGRVRGSGQAAPGSLCDETRTLTPRRPERPSGIDALVVLASAAPVLALLGLLGLRVVLGRDRTGSAAGRRHDSWSAARCTRAMPPRRRPGCSAPTRWAARRSPGRPPDATDAEPPTRPTRSPSRLRRRSPRPDARPVGAGVRSAAPGSWGSGVAGPDRTAAGGPTAGQQVSRSAGQQVSRSAGDGEDDGAVLFGRPRKQDAVDTICHIAGPVDADAADGDAVGPHTEADEQGTDGLGAPE